MCAPKPFPSVTPQVPSGWLPGKEDLVLLFSKMQRLVSPPRGGGFDRRGSEENSEPTLA